MLEPEPGLSEARDSAVSWTAAVINFDGGDAAADTVSSLKELRQPPAEVLLIDDQSTDESVSIVRSRHPDVRILPMPGHSGRPAAVRNMALRHARHRYVLLCDNDIRLTPESTTRLFAAMRSAPDIAVCSAIVVHRSDPQMVQVRAQPLHYLCWSTAIADRRLSDALARGLLPGIGCGVQLVDREAAEIAGFFDDNLAFGWMDDGDLHLRLSLFGYRVLSVPDAVAVHGRKRTVSRTYGQLHNRWYVLLSHYQLRTLIAILPALALFELLLLAQAILSRRPGSYFRALRDVWAKLPQILEQRRRIRRHRRVDDSEILCAGDLDVPRHLRDGRGLAVLQGTLSAVFRWYWYVVRRVL